MSHSTTMHTEELQSKQHSVRFTNEDSSLLNIHSMLHFLITYSTAAAAARNTNAKGGISSKDVENKDVKRVAPTDRNALS
jgi:hypothetical protein